MLLALATVFSLYPLPLQLPIEDRATVHVVRVDPAYRSDVLAQGGFARLQPPAPGCYQLAYTPPAEEAPSQWCAVERPQIASPTLPVMAAGGSYQIALSNVPSVNYRWSVTAPSANQEIAAGGGHMVHVAPTVAGEHRLHVTATDARLAEATTTITYPLTVEPSLPRFVIVDLKPVTDDRSGYLLRAIRSQTLLTAQLTLQLDGEAPGPWLLGHDRYAPATARLATVRIADTGEIIATRQLNNCSEQ